MKKQLLILSIGLTLGVTALVAHPPNEPAPSADQVHPLLIGAKVPHVTVKKGDGTDVDLAAIVKKQSTILIFYRGGW